MHKQKWMDFIILQILKLFWWTVIDSNKVMHFVTYTITQGKKKQQLRIIYLSHQVHI